MVKSIEKKDGYLFCIVFIVLALMLIPQIHWAISLPTEYQQLSSSQKEKALSIMKSEYLYDCCDQTIYKCLEKSKSCDLALRMTKHICRLVKDGEEESDIRLALSLRAQTMQGSSREKDIKNAGFPYVGDAETPIALVTYICTGCPFCRQLIPTLCQSITDGFLKGKVKLIIKPFPIKSHANAVEGASAFMAAHNQGKGIPYLLAIYETWERLKTPQDFSTLAREMGLDMVQFEEDIHQSSVKNALVECKKEGLYVGVKSTPTFFLNGRPFLSELTMSMFHDLVGEELERSY